MGDAVLELGRRPLGDDAAAVEDRQPVHRPLGLDDVVGDQEHGRALVGKRPHLLPEQPAPDRVDVVGRLVEDDDPAGDDGGHRERHEPLDAAGQLRAVGPAPLLERQRLDEALAPLADRGRARASQPADELDRLVGRQPVDRQLRLRLERAGLAGEARVGDRIAAVDPDRPGVGLEQPDDLVDERRLAGAVVAEQAEHLPGVDRQVDARRWPGRPGPGASASGTSC